MINNLKYSNNFLLKTNIDKTSNLIWENKKKLSELLKAIDELKEDWNLISKSISFFSKNQCKKLFNQLKLREKTTPWLPEEDTKLLELTSKINQVNWYECSVLISGRNPNECRKRCAILSKNINIIGNWSYGEQKSIFKFIIVFKFSWKKIVELLPGRSQNSVKSFFHSTIRRIKKSKLFKFLKVMVTWPTYTNKSKNFKIF